MEELMGEATRADERAFLGYACCTFGRYVGNTVYHILAQVRSLSYSN